jgi:soluble lytic murein transglycosylase
MWAFDAEMEGKEDALELYARVAGDYPGSRRGEWAAVRPGFFYYKRGDYQAALEIFRNPANVGPKSQPRQAALFWEAKALEALGDIAGARAARIALCARFPFGFYGHLARIQLEAGKAFPDSLSWKRRLAGSKPQAIKSWLQKHVPGFKDTLRLSGESAYLPLELLLEWKLDTLAVRTLRTLPASDLRNPWNVYVVAGQCQRAGLWRDAYLLGARMSYLLPLEHWGSAPRPVLRRIYPSVYPEAVGHNAAQQGLPPALLLALMKQESGFDAKAISPAGARGLMQMMPTTGTLQAKREGMEDFTPDRLFEPEINARLGAAFLGDVVERYEGNLYFALAHYNAGPTSLGRWMPRLAGRPPEDAVEDIDYAETREYVKKVLANYWTYQVLYE